MKTGDDIYAIGAPKGMAYTLTKGSVSAKERMIGKDPCIQIDAPINQGNSGGIGLAIPISRICDYLSSIGIALSSSGTAA